MIMTTKTPQLEVQNLWLILKYTFALVPIAAGADKFLNLLTQWESYIHPAVAEMLPISAGAFMMVVGVIEIVAGILVFVKTKIGAYVVSAWLIVIALSLVFSGQYLDVAVRDIVMAISAFVLAKLTDVVQQ
ncbi:MAG: hypothetical protein DHS20C18_14870 [Saprospiraceae bacterium]|nr:MAG: hypothetical protein DHS20C18_14870 [Saprospiraceae bacterium]